MCECGYIYRGQRTTFGVGPHLPPCFRQGLCCFSTAYTRLAGLQSSADSPESISSYRSSGIIDVYITDVCAVYLANILIHQLFLAYLLCVYARVSQLDIIHI